MTAAPMATVVLGRVALERDRLARGRRDLLGAVKVERWPGGAVVARLSALLERTDVRLVDVATELAKGVPDERALELLHNGQQAVDRVLAETLQITVGALARTAGVDDGACEEADLFVARLAARIDPAFARPTVPGEAEFVHRAADVVRRRVPDHGVWDLPVMAHEFGHLVVAGLQSYDGGTDRLDRPVEDQLSRKEGMRRRRDEELFCDMFATFAIGPAYPCAQVFHRFDPLSPAEPATDGTHPSDTARVYACLWVLRRMRGSGSAVANPYDSFVSRIEETWTLLQRDAPASSRLTQAQTGPLNVTMSGFWTVLTGDLPTVPTAWGRRIGQVSAYLRGRAAPPTDLDPVEVLNAAWRLRLDAWTGGAEVPVGFDDTVRSLVRARLGVEGALRV